MEKSPKVETGLNIKRILRAPLPLKTLVFFFKRMVPKAVISRKVSA